MAIRNLYLPGFSNHLCGSPARSQARGLADGAETLSGLAGLVARFIPVTMFALGADQRERVFTPWVTFLAFLGQVLSRGSACREAVRQVQAWRAAAGQCLPGGNTSAYCQGRDRLALSMLRGAHQQINTWLERHVRQPWRWYGRTVKVIDGCGISMPDTTANRKRWPYAGNQKPGCGFPSAKMVGLFCLATGRLVRFAVASWKTHEIPLARLLLGWIEPGEIVLADRGFCGWGFLALLQRKGVDVVIRVHPARKLARRTTRWTKPQRKATWTQALWAELPAAVAVRLVRFRIEIRGFRTDHVVLVTTLLDQEKYPDAAIAALYRRRWAVELCFRDIKTTLGLDVLRCQSPELIEKEIWLHALAYNLVRALMVEAAWLHGCDLDRLSFKGTVATLRQWAPLCAPGGRHRRIHREQLLHIIAADQVPDRPNRSEPRARKRRPKCYQMLTRPRHQMVVSPSRALR